MSQSLNAKQKMLNYLSKTDGYNTFSIAQGQKLFGVKNVSARIEELRKEGHVIYTNTVTRRDGSKVNVYKLGSKPTREFIAQAYAMGIRY